jgi:sulfite reductase (NADPH) flavoprotein alpha-component
VFWYFGYGSNMDLSSLRAKGIVPRLWERGVLPGWRLRFNVQHFFRHEGGVANIERGEDSLDAVWGLLHLCYDEDLRLLDIAEACGHGYDRINVEVHGDRGRRQAVAYIGIPSFLDQSCRPTRRYLNILLKGATTAGLDSAYVDALRGRPVYQPEPAPQFVPPAGNHPVFTAATLARCPLLTALAGAVFDMADARWQHRFLNGVFGGRDMTLFHLKRLDTSDGSETIEDVKHGRLSVAQQQYLNHYLHEYSKEYVYVGRFVYD